MNETERVRREFRTSSRFGIIGVIVVMVVVAALALTFGSGQSNPKLLMAVIFVIVFGFVAVLMTLQRRDLAAAERRSGGDATEPAKPVTDPGTAETIDIVEALALKPVNRAAVQDAWAQSYKVARKSMNSGAILMVLIACAVVPWQIWQFKWSLIVVVPIIVLYASYLAIRVIMPGGTLDTAFDSTEAMSAPLGLNVVEKPKVKVRRRVNQPGLGLQQEMTGALAYEGTRHGRHVSIRIPYDGDPTVTSLSGEFPAATVRVDDGRLRAGRGAPAAVGRLLEPLGASENWKGVSVSAGPTGIQVERKKDGAVHWTRDLWLAERLADALSSG